MKYILRLLVLGGVPEIEIDESEFCALLAAQSTLRAVLSVEELYEFVVANYLAVESQLINTSVTDTVRATLTYSEIFSVRSALNLSVVNLLTSTRMYLDQLPKNIADSLPSIPDAANLIRLKASNEYDQYFEYRFMEAMRNHVQHCGTPIHHFTQGRGWTSFDDNGELEFTIDILAQRSVLQGDEKFKKIILAEMPDSMSLKAAIRRYVESLSAIHEAGRNLTGEAATYARRKVEEARTRYSELHDGSLVGLAAMEIDGDRVLSKVPLLLEWDDVRVELQRRNKQLINLSRRFATGRISDGR